MNPILSTKEAAEFLGTTSEVVRRWCREGYLPAVKIGREYRISTAALVDWWEDQGGGRLDFQTFYSVQKVDNFAKKKTDEVIEEHEEKTDEALKRDKKKATKIAEKEDMKQRVIERRIVRGGL